jgi:hypothetical protein
MILQGTAKTRRVVCKSEVLTAVVHIWTTGRYIPGSGKVQEEWCAGYEVLTAVVIPPAAY